MREFKIIDSAESADKLRMRLKDNELEEYGDSLIPEYVYDVIKRLPRFSTMRVCTPSLRLIWSLTIHSAATSRTPRNSLASFSRVFTMNAFPS